MIISKIDYFEIDQFENGALRKRVTSESNISEMLILVDSRSEPFSE